MTRKLFLGTARGVLFLLVLLFSHPSQAQGDHDDLTNNRVRAGRKWLPNGIGLKLFGPLISYKRYFRHSAFEVNTDALTGGLLGAIPRIQVQYFYQTDLHLLENLQWYAGGGLHYYKALKNGYYEIGPNFLAGLEYNFTEAPVSLCLDAGPNFGYEDYYGPTWKFRLQVSAGVKFRW